MSSIRRMIRVMYSPRYLIVTNTITGGVFFGTGDYIVQRFIEDREPSEIDPKRIITTGISGLAIGVGGHYWYGFLDRTFVGNTASSIKKKLFAELLMGPPFAASIFVMIGALESKNFIKIWSDIKENMKYLILADWCFYIPLQYINFYYFRPKFRVLFVAAISIVYDSLLVYIIRREDIKETKLAKKQIELSKVELK